MNRTSSFGFVSLIVLLAAAPAFAQAQGGGAGRQGGQPGQGGTGRPGAQPAALPPIVPLPKLMIEGLGGVTFDHTAGGVYGGGVSYTASKHVQILVEAGRWTNVLPKASAGNLNAVAASFVASGTTPFSYKATRPGGYGMGELRITSRMSRSGLQIFLEGGAGIAHVTSKVSATSNGVDETAAFSAAINPLNPETKAMFSAGTGLTIRAGKRSAVDLGYNYSRIMTTAPRLTTKRIYMAIRVGI